MVEEAKLTIGGSGGICASGAARLGLRVAMVGVVGDDVLGRFMVEELSKRGVDVSAVQVDPVVPTGLTVHLVHGEDRAMLTQPGTIACLEAGLVDLALLRAARHVHVSSYFLQAQLWPGLAGLLAEARDHGASVSVDPNWDPTGTWDQGLASLLPMVDQFLPNGTEARNVARALTGATGLALKEPATADPAATAEEPATADAAEPAAAALAALGPTVVVKLGPQGALAVGGGRVVRAASLDGVSPVDTVGAGDSFDAGYLAGALSGYPLERALALGVACGALSTRASGGTDAQATREEAESYADRVLANSRLGS